ncbi:L-lysine 2,3-aminomutase [Maioricimonas rarisocia]|uniref:L-lysine 2,3-aminomutase n=1 Tax=Maioricimonas rarisocia TaxID=2528026 RepID=A0A517ZB69_9PLAN|nr:EF-P beta-lysylation protein EpmB [Maioricimonas rarisocia]QDU39742.1 L-lysine 2,3-aminomutase [Maioricimonas rarisocia]
MHATGETVPPAAPFSDLPGPAAGQSTGVDKAAEGPSWHRELAAAIRDADRLIDLLELPEATREPARRAARLFPLMVPPSYLRRMHPGDVADPLLRQVLPLEEEFHEVAGFVEDAVGDAGSRRADGLLHKYHGRALLITTGACAVHCRYCFRRHYPYGEEPKRLEEWNPALKAIAGDRSIREVILSGGDPLMLTDVRLEALVERLAAIGHLRRLRIHSRLPIVLPSRVTARLLDLLTGTRMQPFMVVHANHARELVGDCADALRRLVRGGIPTLNQAVLLRGINETFEAQRDLCETLINLGVQPYYLHQLDRVRGAAHFEAPDAVGLEIIKELRRHLPGYAVPQFVREVAGAEHKTPI